MKRLVTQISFDELYAGFFGRYSPLWNEIEREREIIDVEYEDLSDQIESNPQLTDNPIPEVQPVLIAMDYADTNNK